MKRLTATEEEVMQWIWDTGDCTVRDLIEQMSDPKPPHSTVSSVVRILQTKGFVGYRAFGKTYQYFPIVSKADYASRSVTDLLRDYFGGSVQGLVSFLVKNEKINPDELQDLIKKLDDQ